MTPSVWIAETCMYGDSRAIGAGATRESAQAIVERYLGASLRWTQTTTPERWVGSNADGRGRGIVTQWEVEP